MRLLRYTDIFLQGSLIIVALVDLAMNDFTFDGVFFVVQFYLGCLQLSGSLIFALFVRPFDQRRCLHLGVSITYLLSWPVVGNALSGDAVLVHLLAVPWLLAAFYFGLSITDLLPRRKQSKFLPHLGF